MIVSKTGQKFEYRKRNINMIQKKKRHVLKKRHDDNKEFMKQYRKEKYVKKQYIKYYISENKVSGKS